MITWMFHSTTGKIFCGQMKSKWSCLKGTRYAMCGENALNEKVCPSLWPVLSFFLQLHILMWAIESQNSGTLLKGTDHLWGFFVFIFSPVQIEVIFQLYWASPLSQHKHHPTPLFQEKKCNQNPVCVCPMNHVTWQLSIHTPCRKNMYLHKKETLSLGLKLAISLNAWIPNAFFPLCFCSLLVLLLVSRDRAASYPTAWLPEWLTKAWGWQASNPW